MDKITLKLSSVNQITLPSALRKILGVQAGDELEVKVVNNAIQLKKAETTEEAVRRIFRELDELRLKREKTFTPEQKAFAEKSRGWTANQYREYIDNLPETIAHRKEKYGI